MIDAPVPLTTAGATWQAVPDLINRGVLGPDGPRLDEWLATGEAIVIKQAPHCTVYRIVLADLDFHLKHYHPADARSRARSLLRASKAKSEAERTREAGARGVPTLEPLAVGESPDGSYLLTRTVPDAQTVAAFLEEELPRLDARRQARIRQRLATALGRFLARMHDAGVVHDDLHPGNLLLRLGADDEAELTLIDLYAVRLEAPLSWPRSRDNLVILNRWFVLRSARSDRLRCWNAYRQARDPTQPRRLKNDVEARKTIRNLENSTLLSNLHFWRARDHRCLGGNRWFRRVRSAVAAGAAAADMELAVLAPLLADPDEPFRRPGTVVLKDSPSSTVIEFDLLVGGVTRRVIYKRFAVTRWTDPWAALFRPAPALRSYVMGHGLRLRGLPTPRPLAVWHRTRFGLFHEGYLLTEKAQNAVELPNYVAGLESFSPAKRQAALRGLIDQAARLLAALHDRRLSHRDLKGANLLVNAVPWFVSSRGAVECSPTPSEISPRPQIWFIDLVGVRRYDRLTEVRRAQNLARLYASFHGRGLVTRTDLLRFLRAYLGLRWTGGSGWKEWYKAIASAFQAKVRRNLRNGRPLG
jgi:tRNA A-37 threonylcarbamoyl transferase component Bud32